MEYLEWNNLTAKRFFNESMAGREVLLYVNEEIINEIGKEKGCTVKDFIQSVIKGVSGQELCKKALQIYQDWRLKNFEEPPYIGYLALFVLAAGTEGEFAPNAYYPRLKKIIGEPPTIGQLLFFDRMDELWADLENWSKEDKHEEIGRFTARIRGGYTHAGIPLSQTLLSEKERKILPNIFSDAELDPTDIPPADVMKHMILKYGGKRLENRTIRLLNSGTGDNDALRNAFLGLVLDDLADWDGIAPEIPVTPTTPGRPSQKRAGLKICLEIDQVAKRITSAALRFKTNGPFPEGDLNFSSTEDSCKWSCREYIDGYSTTLKDIKLTPPQAINAMSIDWTIGILLEDKEKLWRARLSGVNARLFLPGNRYAGGIPGWVESNRFERTGEFLIACYGDAVTKVRSWGANNCENFREYRYEGLQSGWSTFRGKNARASCPGVDSLTLSSLLRLSIQGGIRIGKGNTYFKFARPIIVLEGWSGSERIAINGNPIQPDTNGAFWHLPDETPIGVPLNIEVRNESGQVLLHQVIKLDEPRLYGELEGSNKRDRFGKLLGVNNNTSWAWGARVEGIDLGRLDEIPIALPTHLSRRIVFLGTHPGEIVDWPNETLPTRWQPVWALIKIRRDHWKVNFCGDPEKSEPVPRDADSLVLPVERRRWKKALLKRRRIDIDPPFSLLKMLWKKYRELALRV